MATAEAVLDRPETEGDEGFPIIDRMIYGALDFAGFDQDRVTGFLEDNYIEARIAADGLSIGRVPVGSKVLDVYDEAIERGDTVAALEATGVFAVVLSSDFIDGFIARGAGIAHHKHGKLLDSLSDLTLRARIAKSIAIDFTDPEVAKFDKAAQLARVGGEGVVALTTVPDFLRGMFETTKTGKKKQFADGSYVLTAMVEKALDASGTKRGKGRKLLHAASMGSLVTATAFAYADGVQRIGKKVQTFRDRPRMMQIV